MFFQITQTIAEVAGALLGFIGVVFVLGGRAMRSLTPIERSGMRHLLIGSIGTLLLSIITLILLAALSEEVAWRISAALLAIYALSGSTKAMTEELRGEHSLPAPFNWGLPITAMSLGVGGLLAAANVLPDMAPVLSVSTMLLGLIVATTYFVSLLTGYHDLDEA
ncbi:MAG: hypothetical protein VX956_11450 [Gemmatimonadota bacterium]|nr:hypothetical protein [Gemmatimonadota bacterium]